ELAAKLTGRALPENFVGTDFVPRLLASLADRGPSIFLYGAAPGIATRAGAALEDRCHGLRVLGVRDGYGDGGQVAKDVQVLRPDILLVGLGNPLQENWIARHLPTLGVSLAIGVGALFDYLAGTLRRAPGWVRRIRCEWVFRLGVEPRR